MVANERCTPLLDLTACRFCLLSWYRFRVSLVLLTSHPSLPSYGPFLGRTQVASLNTTRLLMGALSPSIHPPLSLVLHIGDLSYAKGYDYQWDEFLSQNQAIMKVFLPLTFFPCLFHPLYSTLRFSVLLNRPLFQISSPLPLLLPF